MKRIFSKKLMKKNGFTLIELLAVIVILSILILLAMPSVLRIMENARKNAFETEVRAYLKAAQTKYAEKAVGNSASQTLYFNNKGTSDECTSNSSDTAKCKVDIEDKKDYTYDITVSIDSATQEPRYSYTIAGPSYKATGSSKKYSESIEVTKK